MDYRTLILRDAPTLYLPLDEGGTTVVDATGHGYSGTCESGVSVGSAPFAASGPSKHVTHAATFPSVSTAPKITIAATDLISHPISALPHFPGALSIEAWLRRTTPSGATPGAYTLLDIFSSGEETYFGYQKPGNTLIFQAFSGSARFVLAPVALDGAWHHLVVTWDGATAAAAYADGVALDFTDSGEAIVTGTPTSAVISGAQTTADMGADYAHVALYPYALSAHQVACHYSMATLGTQDCYAPLIRLVHADGPDLVRLRHRAGGGTLRVVHHG